MNITTPCCKAPVHIETQWSGRFGGEQTVGLSCTAYGCYNTWEPDGTADPDNDYLNSEETK